jgi:RNA polymerase sigma factor (sigma-70 family)
VATARSSPRHIGDLLAHARWVKRIAADLVDRDLAEDVAQDVWEASMRRPPADRSAPRAWLRTVVLNLVRAGYRSDRRRQARETAVSTMAEASGDSPEELTIRTELQRRLAEQILALREPYREAVYLRYVEDLTAAQIARLLRVPAGTVRRRLKVGLDRLRENLGARSRERELWVRLIVPAGLGPAGTTAGGGWRPAPGVPAAPVAAGPGRGLALGALLAAPVIIVAVALWAPSRGAPRAARASLPATGARAPVFVPVAADGLEPGGSQGAASDAAEPPADRAAVAIEGRVLDTDGAGLAGASVTVWSTRSDVGGERARKTVTDGAGRYRIPVPPGRYVLRATSPGFGRATSWLDVRGTSVVDLRLHLPSRLAGQVVDATSGQPQPGGWVTVTARQGRPRSARVDATGAFALDVEPGRYRVSAHRGPLFGVSDPVQARPGESASVRVALTRTAAIHGRVLGDTGGGLAGVTVSARAADDRRSCRGFQARTTSAADGSYRLEGLPPCRLTLDLQARGHVPRALPVGATTGRTDRRLDAQLAVAAAVAGQVRDVAGAPVAGARIYYMGAAGGSSPPHRPDADRAAGASPPPRRQVVTDPQGGFELDGLPPGDFWLVAQHPRGTARLGPERVAAGQARRLSIALGPPSWVSGRVAYPDGAPVPGFSLQAIATRDDETVGPPAVAVTGDDGRFTVGPLAAGAVSLRPMRTWFVISRGANAAGGPVALTLGEGERRSGVQLTVPRPEARLQGTVIDARGQSVAGATVDVFVKNGDSRGQDFELRAFTDEAGRFQVDGLPAGTRSLVVDHPVHGRARRSGLGPASDPLTLRLRSQK